MLFLRFIQPKEVFKWLSLSREENCPLREGNQGEIPYIIFLNRSAHTWEEPHSLLYDPFSFEKAGSMLWLERSTKVSHNAQNSTIFLSVF